MARTRFALKDPTKTIRMRLRLLGEFTAGDVVKALRPAELTYLCEICDELRALRICDDVFFDDEEDEDDAEESD